MLSQKSLRAKFIFQLAFASAMLIFTFSVLLYHYIRITVYENSAQILTKEASILSNQYDISGAIILKNANLTLDIKPNLDSATRSKYIKSVDGDRTFLTLDLPLKGDKQILSLTADTTIYSQIIDQILTVIIIVNITMIFLILFYAMLLSRTLLMPIKAISNKILDLNEKVLEHIDESKIPAEFKPLSVSINRLIDRVQTFVGYQKELFVGAAHELKTPLAVMKTKNEVTLLKPREQNRYIEALKNSIESIDTMNKTISSILEIGRQESAQFENPIQKEMISYITKLAENFQILAKNSGKNVALYLSPTEFYMRIQPTLFLHIIQNFVQNAIKFTPDNGTVVIRSKLLYDKFIIEVIDDGPGIDESLDLFAPFKRYGKKGGTGLGLFLAKSAAQAMNADISIKNRSDKQGCIAVISLPISKKERDKNVKKSSSY